MIKESTIKKAIKTERRKHGKRQKDGTIRLLEQMRSEPVDALPDEHLDTACWRFDRSTNTHHIKVGQEADRHLNVDTIKKPWKLRRFLRSLIWHETAHGRYTKCNSMKSEDAIKELQTVDCPFWVFNTTEDCYIEAQEWSRTRQRFGWSSFDRIKVRDTDNPCRFLFAMCQREARSKKYWRRQAPKWTGLKRIRYNGKDVATKRLLLDFFDRFTGQRNFLCDRVEITKEFWLVFKDLIPNDIPDDMRGRVDGTIDGNPDPNGNGGTGAAAPSNTPAKNSEWDQWDKQHQGDYENAIRIGNCMTNISAMSSRRRRGSAMFGSKVHPVNIVKGAQEAFRGRSPKSSKRKLFAVIDMSGSMLYNIEFGGCEFVSALRILDERGIADVEIVLTNRSLRADVSDVPSRELMTAMPMDGGEGMQGCLQQFRDRIAKADTAIIFTDAALSDAHTDFGIFRGQVDLIGCCVSDSSKTSELMRQWFQTILVRSSAIELARSIAMELSRG